MKLYLINPCAQMLYKTYLKIGIILITPFLLTSCASNKAPEKLVYCSWSLDDSRWPTHQTNTRNLFFAAAMGLNEIALRELTGGEPKFERRWDNQGHLIEIQSNSNGIVAAFDTRASCYLTPKAYGMRQVGRYTYDDLIRLNFIRRP
jgi:hypothetical protein